jgi:hypothetical protein
VAQSSISNPNILTPPCSTCPSQDPIDITPKGPRTRNSAKKPPPPMPFSLEQDQTIRYEERLMEIHCKRKSSELKLADKQIDLEGKRIVSGYMQLAISSPDFAARLPVPQQFMGVKALLPSARVDVESDSEGEVGESE